MSAASLPNGRRASRQLNRDVLVGMVLMDLLLVASNELSNRLELAPAADLLLWLLPVLPAGWAAWRFATLLPRIDELERQVYLEGGLLGTGLACLAAMVYGRLVRAGVVADFPFGEHALGVIALLLLAWVIGVAVAWSRYSE